jgi:hypothetical protein
MSVPSDRIAKLQIPIGIELRQIINGLREHQLGGQIPENTIVSEVQVTYDPNSHDDSVQSVALILTVPTIIAPRAK